MDFFKPSLAAACLGTPCHYLQLSLWEDQSAVIQLFGEPHDISHDSPGNEAIAFVITTPRARDLITDNLSNFCPRFQHGTKQTKPDVHPYQSDRCPARSWCPASRLPPNSQGQQLPIGETPGLSNYDESLLGLH